MIIRAQFSMLPVLLASVLVATTPSLVAAGPKPPTAPATAAEKASTHEKYGKLPLAFEANQGQVDRGVRFLSRGSGYSLFLTSQEAVLSLGKTKPDLIGMKLSGASLQTRASANRIEPTGEDQLLGKVNYFLGNDPTKWRANLPTYAKVRYAQVYPGVDLVYYGNQGRLEYDFVVAAGASASTIRLEFSGERRLRIASNGDLVLEGRNGSASFHKPVVYQEKDGQHLPVAGNFRKLAGNTVGFSLGSYDHTRKLVIDPTLVYSTYLGGSVSDQGNGIAVDADGCAYVVGTTQSTDFPVIAGAIQSTFRGVGNVFVSKFNAAGTALVYSTYLGGSGVSNLAFVGGDVGMAIAVDSEKNAYITGTTASKNFPVTKGAFQTRYPSVEPISIAFVAKLDSTGSSLAYSTYLGGWSDGTFIAEVGKGIAVDGAGSAFVAGFTSTTNFPVTPGAFQSDNATGAKNCTNAFVTKLKPDGSSLVYSTYLGGSGDIDCISSSGGDYGGDEANAIAIDSSGNAYVVGSAFSDDFPVTGEAFQRVNHAQPYLGNAFVTKLNSTGTKEIYSTYLGGDGNYGFSGEYASGIVVDSSGHAYITGVTDSFNFPVTSGALRTAVETPPTNYNLGFGFAAKLNPDGSALDYSTYLGELGATPTGLTADSNGNSYITGFVANYPAEWTAGGSPVYGYDGDFPEIPGAFSRSGNTFVAKLNATGTALEYGTLMGGINDAAHAIAQDTAGNIYITGIARSTIFPATSGAFQTANKAPSVFEGGNAFVSKLALASKSIDYFPSFTAISSVPALPALGKTATLSAKVTGASGTATPTGNVTFTGTHCSSYFIGGQIWSGCEAVPTIEGTLDSEGVMTSTTPPLKVGLTTYNASYLGDAQHLTSNTAASPTPLQFLEVGAPVNLRYANGYDIGYTYGGYSQVPLVLYVQVTDSAGYYVKGVGVSFSGAGLKFSPADTVSDAQGWVSGKFTALKAGNPLEAIVTAEGIEAPIEIPIYVYPAPLQVLLHGNFRNYGAANPTILFTYTGLVGSETVTLTPVTTATPASPVGIYPITVQLSGPYASNYKVEANAAMLNVYRAPLYVVARNETVRYGQTPTPPTGYTLTGFVNGETASVVSGAPLLSTSVTSATPVGFYPINVGLGTLTAANYKFEPGLSGIGSVQVLKAPLKATANNLTMTQGAAVPSLTYSLTGFVNEDTAATAVTGIPTLSTTATSASAPGQYPISITPGTLAAGNYYFTSVNGVVTVAP